MEVHKDHIVIGELQSVKKKMSVGTSLKVKEGQEVYKGQLLTSGGIDIREYMKIV